MRAIYRWAPFEAMQKSLDTGAHAQENPEHGLLLRHTRRFNPSFATEDILVKSTHRFGGKAKEPTCSDTHVEIAFFASRSSGSISHSRRERR